MIARRLAAGIVVAGTCAVAYVLACGPIIEEIPTVTVVDPANVAAYAKGNVGVVRPRLARRYLVQAYRVLSGRPPLALSTLRPDLEPRPAAGSAPKAPEVEWSELARQIVGPAAVAAGQMKRVPGDTYQEFLNCPDSAFENAIRSLRARVAASASMSAVMRVRHSPWSPCSHSERRNASEPMISDRRSRSFS